MSPSITDVRLTVEVTPSRPLHHIPTQHPAIFRGQTMTSFVLVPALKPTAKVGLLLVLKKPQLPILKYIITSLIQLISINFMYMYTLFTSNQI